MLPRGTRQAGTGICRAKARRYYPNILFLAGVLLCASPLLPQTEVATDELTQESLKFTQIYGAVEQNYMDSVNPDQTIMNGAIRGMLSVLDPFSAFFDRDQFELLQQQARGEALGFGSILYVQPGKVLVLQTAQGSPSWRAGLGPGDEIVEINGTRIDRLEFNSLVELLQRARSQPVRLGVVHPGKVVPQDFELKPAEVALPTVDKSFLVATGIGYIHLSAFETKTPQEVVDALKRLEVHSDAGGPVAQGSLSNPAAFALCEGRSGGPAPAGRLRPPLQRGLKGLLLDLRDNHGGMLEAALGVTSLFLKPNLLVLTVRGRAGPEQSYRTFSTAVHFDLPLVVLVNGNTASAAEVVAAALQEHDRALIVGEPTFGKGVVETVMALSEKTGLALTTAQYVTPSGRSIQRSLPGTALAATEIAASFTPAREHAAPRGAAAQDIRANQQRAEASNGSVAFYTDNGRPVFSGGGVKPDVAVPPRTLDPWVTFLNQRGAFTEFASEYVTLHGKVDRAFEPDSEVLDNFKDFLGRQRVRVPQNYWSADQAYLKVRIKTELLNLVYGLVFGDEVETRDDPQVQQAVTLFPRIPMLLKPPAAKPGTARVTRAGQQGRTNRGYSALVIARWRRLVGARGPQGDPYVAPGTARTKFWFRILVPPAITG